MVVETKVRESGVWRLLTNTEVKLTGTWRDCKSVEVKESAVWRTVFGGVVTVSGETAADTAAINRNARAAIVFRTDGTVDKIENATTTQIDTSTDWIIPTTAASSNYEVKYDFVSGDTLDVSTTLADGAWGDLGGDKFFEQRATFSPDQSRSTTITISVRKNGGAVLDSANYILNATAVTI